MQRMIPRVGIAALCALLMAFGAIDRAWAQIEPIEPPLAVATVIYISPDGNDQWGYGTSWSPYATIGKGIEMAVDGDTVLVLPGTYTGDGNRNLDPDGKRITITSQAGPTVTIVDLTGSEPLRRFMNFTSWETDETVVSGFTVRNGYADPAVYDGGGAVDIDPGSPMISNCVFENCEARTGGAIYMYTGLGPAAPTIVDCTFTSNTATTGVGGAIYSGKFGGPDISNCVFTGNTARKGGAVFGAGGAQYIDNCVFKENSTHPTATDGGGGAVYASTYTKITNSTFVGNRADYGSALAMYASYMEFERNIVAGNKGYGAYFYNTYRTVVWECNDFWRNELGDFDGPGALDPEQLPPSNIYVNPAFCEGSTDISSYSACAAANSPCGELIGAGQESCTYLCGDLTIDWSVDISDLVYMVDWMYQGGPPPEIMEAANMDCSPGVDISDLVYLVDYMFKGGPAPICDCDAPLVMLKSVPTDFAVTTVFADRATTFTVDSSADLRGLQIEVRGDLDGDAKALVAGGFELLTVRADGRAVYALTDLTGHARIPAGETAVLQIAGRAEVVGAVAVDEASRRLEIGEGSERIAVAGGVVFEGGYPNPFNPQTKLAFSLPSDGHVNLVVYNVRGQKVVELVDRVMTTGRHEIDWDGRDATGRMSSAGLYFAKLRTEDATRTKKLVIIK